MQRERNSVLFTGVTPGMLTIIHIHNSPGFIFRNNWSTQNVCVCVQFLQGKKKKTHEIEWVEREDDLRQNEGGED